MTSGNEIRDVLGIGAEGQGEILEEKTDPERGDDRRYARRLAQRLIGEPLDRDPQEGRPDMSTIRVGMKGRLQERDGQEAEKAPTMNRSPWAKLIMVRMP